MALSSEFAKASDFFEDNCTSEDETSFDELLISEVYKKTVLWNKGEYYFRNSDVRNRMWETIGSKLNLSGSECKSRWTYLREKFRREYKKIQENNEKASSTVSNLKPVLSESEYEYENIEYLEDIHDTVDIHSSDKLPIQSIEKEASKNDKVIPIRNIKENPKSMGKVSDKGHSTDDSEGGRGKSNSEICVSSDEIENKNVKGGKKKTRVNPKGQAKRTKNNLRNKQIQENVSNSEYNSSEETADKVCKKLKRGGKTRSKAMKKMTSQKWAHKKPVRALTMAEFTEPGTSNRGKRTDKVTAEQNTSLKSAITDINTLVHGVLQAPQETPKINQNQAFCTYLQSEMETFPERENWILRKIVLTEIINIKQNSHRLLKS